MNGDTASTRVASRRRWQSRKLKRIDNGEAADVVIVQPDFAADLTGSGKVSAGDRPIIAHVGVGLGNRKDGPAYDISTVEKFKST